MRPLRSSQLAMCSTSHQNQVNRAMCNVYLPVLTPGPVTRGSEKACQTSLSDSSFS